MNRKEKARMDSVLRKIEREATTGDRFLPIVGPEKGRFYYLAAKASGVRSVLELGTLIGYSALLFYKALDGKGRITTVEYEKDNLEEAEANFAAAGMKGIETIRGDALKVVKKLAAEGRRFDVIFLDIEKNEYVEIFDNCIRLLRKGGLLLVDNALWDTPDLKAFRKMLAQSKKAESVIIPIGDGIAMSVKR